MFYSPLYVQVQSPSCTVPFAYVQYPSCTVPMFSPLCVQSSSCTVPFIYSPFHVQCPSCSVFFMYTVPMYSPHVQSPCTVPIVQSLQSPLYSPHCTVPFMYNPHAKSPCRIPFVYSPLLYGPLHILSPSCTFSVIYRLFLVQPASSCIVQSFWLATA